MRRQHDLNTLTVLGIVIVYTFVKMSQAKIALNNTTVNVADFSKLEETRPIKKCPGALVVGIASARLLRGCTIIKGNLEIAIREECERILQELEENLKDIRIIEGYLKVLRSHPLTSLNFLKNLTEIRGNDLGFKDYSLLVLDNLNLQELWNWDDHGIIKIGSRNGDPKVLFHYNPKLCPQTIEGLKTRSGLKPFSKIDVSLTNNGDKVICNPLKRV